MQKQALEFYEDSETGESLPPIKNSTLDSRTCLYFEEAGNSGSFKGACLPAACSHTEARENARKAYSS